MKSKPIFLRFSAGQSGFVSGLLRGLCTLLAVSMPASLSALAHVSIADSTFDTQKQALRAAQWVGCKGSRKVFDGWKACSAKEVNAIKFNAHYHDTHP
jgi:hypothetical protein